MGKSMISLSKITNWQSKKAQQSGQYLVDSDLIDWRLNNNLPIREEHLGPAYKKIGKYNKKKDYSKE